MSYGGPCCVTSQEAPLWVAQENDEQYRSSYWYLGLAEQVDHLQLFFVIWL